MHDWDRAFYALLASDRLLQGYFNHPPAVIWSTKLAFIMFGETELATRFVPLVFSIASLVLIFKLTQDVYGEVEAILATFFLAASPLAIYYSRQFGHYEFFILASIYCFYKWGGKGYLYLVGSCASLFIGLLFDYPILIAMLPILYLAYRNRDMKGALATISTNLIVVASWFLYLTIANKLEEVILAGKGFSMFFLENIIIWLKTQFVRAFYEVPFTIPLLSSIWFIVRLFKNRMSRDKMLIIWILASVAYLVLLSEHSYELNWTLVPLIIPLSISSGIAMEWIFGLKIKKVRIRSLGAILILLTLAMSIKTSVFYSQINDISSYQSGLYIKEHTEKGDVIVASTPTELWYSERRGYICWERGILTANELDMIIKKEHPVFVSIRLGTLMDNSYSRQVLMANNYSIVKIFWGRAYDWSNALWARPAMLNASFTESSRL